MGCDARTNQNACDAMTHSPGTNDLEVVLDALVVDVATLFKVAHLDLLVTNTRLDSGHGANGGAGRTHGTAEWGSGESE